MHAPPISLPGLGAEWRPLKAGEMAEILDILGWTRLLQGPQGGRSSEALPLGGSWREGVRAGCLGRVPEGGASRRHPPPRGADGLEGVPNRRRAWEAPRGGEGLSGGPRAGEAESGPEAASPEAGERACGRLGGEPSLGALEAPDVAVRLEAGEEDVEEPEAEEERGGGDLGAARAAQLAADVRPAPVEQHGDAHEGEDGEERDGEGQRARAHLEGAALHRPVHGGHRPGHAQAQEHVHRVGAGHVADGRVRALVLQRRHLAGEGVCGQRHARVTPALAWTRPLACCPSDTQPPRAPGWPRAPGSASPLPPAALGAPCGRQGLRP